MSIKSNKKRSGLRKSKYPALITAAALTASLSFSMVSFGAYGSNFDWQAGADQAAQTVQNVYDQAVQSYDEYFGAGNIREEAETEAAPEVNESVLAEQYHEEYQIYEESLANRFFFYSNVANGGITHEPVILDMPVNLIYSFEKDGAPWQWTPGQKISAKGTYVMSITAVDDTSLPLSEQKEYNAVFRFRIQDEPPKTASQSGNSYESGSQMTFPNGSVPFGMETDTIYETVAPTETETEVPTEPVEETTAAETDGTSAPEGAGAALRTQEYDSASGQYLVTLENGKQLVSNIPEGYIGNLAVQVIVPEEDAETVTVFYNDEEIEYVRENSFVDAGQYRVVVDGYEYHFTVASYVNEMTHYPAPTGMEIVSCTRDGEALRLTSGGYVSMDQDGVYVLEMKGEADETIEVALTKDSVPPSFEVTVQSGTANIQYLTDDTESIQLFKDGNTVDKFAGYTVTDPGKYSLVVTDHAGNMTQHDFTIKYQVNGYGIAAVILVIILIAGGVVFVLRTKKNMTIR